MNRSVIVLTLPLLLLACGRPEKAPGPPSAPRTSVSLAEKPVDIDRENLLNIAYGASVVSRTGELNLEFSAAHAIDGLASSRWSSPPGGPAQTFVFSLGAPSRIHRIGILTSASESDLPDTIHIEVSTDGAQWKEAATLKPVRSVDPQFVDIAPVDAFYVRARTDDAANYYASIYSLQLLGRETAPPAATSIAGCWTINGRNARFVQRGARVAGVIDTEPPTLVDGGTDGRTVRLMYVRGPLWGHAMLTLTPDSSAATAITFLHHYIPYNMTEAWFGQRQACSATTVADPAAPIFERAGRLRLYGLEFDANDRLIAKRSESALEEIASLAAARPSLRFRLTAHDLRSDNPEENRKRTAARIESLRAALQAGGTNPDTFEFVAAGDRSRNPDMVSMMQRLLASCIEIEPLR